MSKLLYFLATFAESGLSVFGIRGAYEQPAYRVVRTIAPDIELRAYEPRVAVETPVRGPGDAAAFGRLFRYITGGNAAGQDTATTMPGAPTPGRAAKLIPMTVPVEMSGGMATMRFFLPAAVAKAGAPQPTERDVRIVALPAVTLGVLRYSGTATEAVRRQHTAKLAQTLTATGLRPAGEPIFFSYDPPFALPFLRRNEVAFQVAP